MSREKFRKSIASGVLSRMCAAVGVRTQTALGEFLGVRQGNISQAISSDHVPDVWLYKVAYATGRRVEWLRTGELPELVNEAIGEALELYRLAGPPTAHVPPEQGAQADFIHDLLAFLRRANAEEQATLWRLVRSLAGGSADIRDHLIRQIALLDRLSRLERETPAHSRGEGRRGSAG